MRARADLKRFAICGIFASGLLVGGAGWCDEPAEPQHLTAQALAYEHGEGVPKDQLKAASLYCEAARLGDAEAQYNLGWMYLNGRGVPRDDALANVLFAMAAAQGHEGATQAQRFVDHAIGMLPECMRASEVVDAQALIEEQALALMPTYSKPVVELVQRLAPGYEIHPRLALAVIATESNFDVRARSPRNAQGLMQLIPETAQRFKVKNTYDPIDNIKGGLAYLRWLLSYYRGRVELALAAYNAGEGAVDRYRGIPPYKETQDYVRRVQRLFSSKEHPFNDQLAEPSPVLTQPVTAAKKM